MALITPARAAELIPNFNIQDTDVLGDIVSAASSLIEKWCNRTFAITTYDELLDGQGASNILLSNYPVISLNRIMFNPNQVLSIYNNKHTVSRASFALSKTALTLDSMDTGVETINNITLSSCPTLADLASAVNTYSALGWSATALGQFATFATSDLYAPQGGNEMRWGGYGFLFHHTYGVSATMCNPDIGEIVSWMGFTRGYRNYRAFYTAGFSTVPYEIQQACAELAAAVYNAREINPNLASESLGGYSYSNIAEKSFSNLSIASRYALAQYRNIRIPKSRA